MASNSSSGILFAVVSRRNAVLATYAACFGNFDEVSKLVLDKIKFEDNGKMTYSHDNYLFHYVCADGIVFMCITDDDFERGHAFAYLAAIQQKFGTQYGLTGRTAIAYAMNSEFGPVLCAEMKKFNKPDLLEHRNPDKIERIRDEVNQVKDIMVTNIDTLVERGERLDLLVNKTEELSTNAVSFKQTSTQLRRKMWWENTKFKIIMVVVVLVLVYVVATVSCGGFAWPKCVGGGGK